MFMLDCEVWDLSVRKLSCQEMVLIFIFVKEVKNIYVNRCWADMLSPA